ncbi:MAG: acyl-CoA dehydrogenase, partial [Desulfobacteraceae bacterium]
GKCRGLLLGEENKGMKVMFLMMNEARLGVGLQGFGFATSSYINAVNYAKDRKQGKNLLQMMDANAPSVSIIEHPDVKRQLLFMKSLIDGMRGLIYFTSMCFDLAKVSDTEEDRERYQCLVEILTPVVKAYCTDKGFDVCVQGMQVYGGYGYIHEYPQEQLTRDCKITSIYEGTNGIQAMDLLGRKLGMKKGKPFMDLLGEMNKTIAKAKGIKGLEDMTAKVEAAVNKLGGVAMNMGATAMSEKVLDAFASALPFLNACGDVIMAWILLWRASVAAEKIAGAKKKEASFYDGQIKTAQFYMNSMLPLTMGAMDALLAIDPSIMQMQNDSFNG